MKIVKEIETLILDINVLDEEVKKEIEKLDSSKIIDDDRNKILSLLKEKRPILFSEWQLEIASNYM